MPIEIVFLMAICGLFFVGSFTLLTQLINVTDSKAVKLLTSMRPDSTNPVWRRYYIFAQKLIEPLIFIEPYKEEIFAKQLKKVGKQLTPRQYLASIWVSALAWVIVIFLCWLSGLHIFCIGFALIGIASTINKRHEITEQIAQINNAIEAELPQFIRTFGQSLEGEKDIIKILKKYRQICGTAFEYDLDVLITDLSTGNQEEALLKFDERLNIPIITSFVSGVIGTTKGIDQKTFFYILERDVKILANENLKRILASRPAKINMASMAVFCCFMLMITYPIIMIIVENTKIFK